MFDSAIEFHNYFCPMEVTWVASGQFGNFRGRVLWQGSHPSDAMMWEGTQGIKLHETEEVV